MRVITESSTTVKVTVSAGQTGIKKSDAKSLRKNLAIRNVAINATVHDPDNDVTLHAGQHTPVDALPDLQSFSTSPHDTPENANKMRQADSFVLEVNVVNAPAVDVDYVAVVSFWVVEYEKDEAQLQ